jgi:hypothetical protein
MNYWREYDIETKVLKILADVPDSAEDHHLGKPFLTAYQIAIEFAQRHPDAVEALGYPVGGAGTGQHNSLTQYLAQQLSVRIRDGRIPVEGGFVSNWHLNDIFFEHKGAVIRSSLTGTGFTLSMFRLRG